MGLRFICPACSKSIVALDRGLGEAINCSACGRTIEVPTNSQSVEHVPDPPEVVGTIKSRETAEAAQQNRELGQRLVLWLFIIINPLLGLMKLISYFVGRGDKQPSELALDALLICLLPIGVSFLMKKRLGVWGGIVVYCAMAVVIALHPNWDLVIEPLGSLLIFVGVVKSRWSKLA